MTKNLAAALIILVVCLIIIFGAILIKLYSPSTSKNQANNLLGNNSENSSKSIVLPMDINDLTVVSATINYNLDANLKQIRTTGSGEELIIENSVKGTPPLLLSPDTLIYYYDGVTSYIAKKSDLKPNQKLRILLVYGLKIKKWTLARVNIIVPANSIDQGVSFSIPNTPSSP